MPSLRTRHSWPPLCEPPSFATNKKIDDDPFAYFISSTEDRDIFFEVDLAAGIRDNRYKSRSLSPVLIHPRRTHKFRNAWSHWADSPTSTFKKWIERMEKQYFNRGPTATHQTLPSPASLESPCPPLRPPVSPPLRGRPYHRTAGAQRATHNGRTPSRRPRSWREPSVDIWPVLEEQEGDS